MVRSWHWAVGGLLLAAACSSHPDAAGDAPRFVTLSRSAHPLATPERDLGRLDPTQVLHNLSLVFKLSPAQQTDRDALLEAMQTPGSPEYHHWLTPEGYAERFGAQPVDISRAAAWLASQGFSVHEPSRLRARVTFTGTVAQVDAAFQTEMHRYAVDGETHYAMARAPSVPAELADITLALHNASDFYPRHSKHPLRVVQPDAKCPAGGACSGNGIAPPDWAVMYDVGPLYSPGLGNGPVTGNGVTIAIVGVADIAQSDLTAFRTTYGLASNPIVKTVVPNTGAAQGENGAGVEAVLDTEWSGGIAPEATVHFVFTGADDGNVDDATYYAIEQNLGDVLSESFGGCEEGLTPADADVVEVYGSAASLEGITFVAASGDSGAAGCGGTAGTGGLYVDMPASYPGVTAVGGTGFAIPSGLTFSAQGTVTARGNESVWNEAHDGYTNAGIGASGGGISSVFSRPRYQNVNACPIVGALPTNVNPTTQREVPDVAFTAAGGSTQYGIFIECTLDPAAMDCSSTGGNPIVLAIGGTSASAPSFAGLVALAVQATGGRLGNLNPLLYALHGTVGIFNDITTGNNEVTCMTADPGCPNNNGLYGYAASAGYDCATGLGSIDATHFVTALVAMAGTTTTLSAPATTSEGANVTLNATVNVLGSNPNLPIGNVTFTFQSYLTSGGVDLSYTLGEVPLGSVNATSGTASLTTALPPGMVKPNQAIDVYALYGGDVDHLPSVSPKQHVTFAPFAFCATPATDNVAPDAGFTYAAVGGVPPVRWYVDFDSTCDMNGMNCSLLDENSGAFTAGSTAGYVLVQVVDSDGAETFSEVTVGADGGVAPWSDGGPVNYAGVLVSNTQLTVCPAPDNCGTLSDNCGGSLTCGTCSTGQMCVANRCVATDAGMGGQDGGGAGTDAGANDAGMGSQDGGGTGTDAGANDAGLRGGQDSGTQSGADAGGGGSSSSGCGCQSATDTTFLLIPGLALLVLRRRRTRQQEIASSIA